MNRPLESCCRSLARTARFIGLRAKATAMPVPNSNVSVAAAPMAMGRKGSCPVSADHTPSYPLASARFAASAIPLGSNPIPPSIFMRRACFPFEQRSFVPRSSFLASLFLAAEVLLQFGGDLIPRGDLADAHGVALG